MTSASLASRIGAVALCVGLSAAPWVRVLGDDCPGPASGACNTRAYDLQCPCAPSGGYKTCDIHKSQSACQSAPGEHDAKNGLWSCKTGSGAGADKNIQCIYGSNKLCWRKYACSWGAASKTCSRNVSQVLDEASYVDKKEEVCGSGGSGGGS
jgi:hypothetical protein